MRAHHSVLARGHCRSVDQGARGTSVRQLRKINAPSEGNHIVQTVIWVQEQDSMRVGIVILTFVLALLSFHESGATAMSIPDTHGSILVALSSPTPTCPDHAPVSHPCCLVICGSLIPATVQPFAVIPVLLERLANSSDAGRKKIHATRLYRPPKCGQRFIRASSAQIS